MSQLAAQDIFRLSDLSYTKFPLIAPFSEERLVINGKSAGLSAASYDARIDHDLTLGVMPGNLWAEYIMRGPSDIIDIRDLVKNNPPYASLAWTVEDFCIPHNVVGYVCDKSSFARVFVTAFNTLFDPGFHGNATLELVNLGTEPVHYKRGDPVCQFTFHWLSRITDRPYKGKYQHQGKGPNPARYEEAADNEMSKLQSSVPSPIDGRR